MRQGILATREELQAIRARLGETPFDEYYEALRSRCALILEVAPIREMHWQAGWAAGRYNAALTAARGAQGRILDLAIADALDPNTAYRSRAVEELMNLVRWSTWVDPSRPNLTVDRCTAEIAVALTIGADLLRESLSDEQRSQIETALEDRMLRPYADAVANDVWWYSAVNHWNAVLNAAAGLTALAMDGSKQSSDVLAKAKTGLARFFNDLGREGGWDEGIGYWGYAVRSVMLFGHALARLDDDQSVLHHRGMEATGLFPIYFTPNGRPASFGDFSIMPTYGALYLLSRYFNCPELTWWLDRHSLRRDPTIMDWSQAGMALVCRDEANVTPPTALEPLKVFQQIGWAALADAWPTPSFYTAVKTGDLATSHAQRDMNSIQVQVDGEMLLVDVGHPLEEGTRYFSGERAEFYELQARAHNTIIVAEEDHCPDAHGEIIKQDATDAYRWVLADGGIACGEMIGFYRHVLMLLDADGRGESLVVVDELDVPVPERVDLFWHTAGAVERDDDGRSGTIVGRKAKLHFGLALPTGCKVVSATHRLASRGTDRMLHVSGLMSGRLLFVSAFSRSSVGPVAVESPEGDMTIRAAGRVVRFQSAGRYRVLSAVEAE